MGTRSNIAYRTPEGRIVSVYCHWDGYPAHNGAILREHYTSTDKIVDLISLGSISSLNKEVGEKQDFNDKSTQKDEWTLAYHRDRGEQLHVSTYNDIPSWIADMEEYAYLWNGQEWIVNDHGEMDGENRYPVFNRVVDVLEDAVA